MPERFTECYGVAYQSNNDWFNPLLTEDTHLYVDPFLIFLTNDSNWSGGHGRLMSFFGMVLELLSGCGFREDAPAYVKAESLFLFPEPPEFCLGVSEHSVMGRGSASKLREGMIRGAAIAIRSGIENLRHFEEIALFGNQIGPDRISDMTCNILKSDFIRYTQKICRKEGIPMERFAVRNANWDLANRRWLSEVVDLPINPYATEESGRPVGVILTPKSFLRMIPTIDPEDFWEYAMSVDGDQLRADLNFEIGQKVDRALIVELAKRKSDLLRRYLENLEDAPKDPYDVEVDPKYLVRGYDDAKNIALALQWKSKPKDSGSLDTFVEMIVTNFKDCVERGKGWKLLWADDRPRSENDAQTLFWTSARIGCKMQDVDITPEAETGRGPVDFKLSQGASKKMLIEVKYAKSSSFWQNTKYQLPIYQEAQECDNGYLVVVQFNDKECSKDYLDKASELASSVSEKTGRPFHLVFVDARPKATASVATKID